MTLVQYWDQINIPKLGSLWGGRTNPKNCACLISLKYFFMRFRPFQSGTVGLSESKDCKVTSCQRWRFEKNSAIRPTSDHTRAAWVRFPYNRIILQLWQLVTLQPVDLQRPTVPLWKYLNLLKNTISNQRTSRIFDTVFAHSKWPHLHMAYLLGVWHSFSVTVCTYIPWNIWGFVERIYLRV